MGYFMEILGDDNRYLQILLNFLSNALKFTGTNGLVQIETRLLDTQNISRTPGMIGAQKSNNKLLIKGLGNMLDQKKLVKRSCSMDKVPITVT